MAKGSGLVLVGDGMAPPLRGIRKRGAQYDLAVMRHADG
jgi:hypothetical protein